MAGNSTLVLASAVSAGSPGSGTGFGTLVGRPGASVQLVGSFADQEALHGHAGAVWAGVRSATQNGVPMIVLGIDPGTASTGYGVVESAGSSLRALAAGVIQTRPGTALERRLAEIHARVGDLLDEHRPAAVAIEELYFGANARTAFAVGQARGVVLLAAGQRGIPSRSYTPQQVKGAVCGHGRADKDQVGHMVMRLLGLSHTPSPDHAADALAVAICECNRAPLDHALAHSRSGAGAGT